MEDRLKAMILICPGFYLQKRFPEVDQLNFAPRVKAPVLMLNGRFDFIFPTAASSQEPMFRTSADPTSTSAAWFTIPATTFPGMS